MRFIYALVLFSSTAALAACAAVRAPLPPIAPVAQCAPSVPAPPGAVAVCTAPDVGAGLAATPADRAAANQLNDVYKEAQPR